MVGNDSDESVVLIALQLEQLSKQLVQANRRIAELERNERWLHIERDRLQQILRQTTDDQVQKTHDSQLWPAEAIDNYVRCYSIVERRDAWLQTLSRLGTGREIFGLYPHDGGTDPITILVRGSGGFGDMIYLSIVVRRLYEHFDAPRIIVLHEHPLAYRVLGNNPYVLDVISLQGERHMQFLQSAASTDVFDLIADVRYVVSYAVPPMSRVPREFLIAAHSRAAEWQSYVRRDWPFLNNMLSKECARRGMSKYDLVGYTSNLPVDSTMCGDFFPAEIIPPNVHDQLKRPYITMHHGADKNMASATGLQTKNLPDDTWRRICEQLTDAGINTVQLGEQHEGLIEGVGVDLRGRTSFAATALVLKHAMAHVDTEGGLVHLARSMGTPSVVAFGPTPVSFFGYRGNENIAPEHCGDCWWVTRGWAVTCPRGMDKPVCMASHSPSRLAKSAIALSASRKFLDVPRGEVLDDPVVPDLPPPLGARIAQLHGADETGGVILAGGAFLKELVAAPEMAALSYTCFVHSQSFHSCFEQHAVTHLRPFVHSHVPADTNSYDWMLIEIGASNTHDLCLLLCEAGRIVKSGGTIYLYLAPNVEKDVLSPTIVETMAEITTKVTMRNATPTLGVVSIAPATDGTVDATAGDENAAAPALPTSKARLFQLKVSSVDVRSSKHEKRLIDIVSTQTDGDSLHAGYGS